MTQINAEVYPTDLEQMTQINAEVYPTDLEQMTQINAEVYPTDLEQMTQSNAEVYWLQCVRLWYPELHTHTYFVPPLQCHLLGNHAVTSTCESDQAPLSSESDTKQADSHSRHLQTRSKHLKQLIQRALWSPFCHPSSFWRHGNLDNANILQLVLHCLHALADDSRPKEAMVILSQMSFGTHLGKPTYQAALDCLPNAPKLSVQLRQQRANEHNGDVLVIHRRRGLVTLQINNAGATATEDDTDVLDAVNQALDQTNEADAVLKHLLWGLPGVNITKGIVMPYVTSSQLLKLTKNNPRIEQKLCHCFGAPSVADALKMCLLSDQLNDKNTAWNITSPMTKNLQTWWQQLIRNVSVPEISMTLQTYEILVSRFCGPAATLSVHCITAPRLRIITEDEEEYETGNRMAKLVLVPEQLALLHTSPPRVFLTGPPGTGKSLALALHGVSCIQRGFDVHVVSTWSESRAATTVITHQILGTMRAWSTETLLVSASVHHHAFDLERDGGIKIAIQHLKSISSKEQAFCVLADEAGPDGEKFTRFCDKLISKLPRVSVWAAAVQRDVRPLHLDMVTLSTPLRSPPVVVREVMEAFEIQSGEVYGYTLSSMPVTADGPAIMRISHHEAGHSGLKPHHCIECGHQIARSLKQLHIGAGSDSDIHYRDVLILCEVYPSDYQLDCSGNKTSMVIGLVQGLRDCHVPVLMLEKDDDGAIRDTALCLTDHVTVTNWGSVRGLERKVVVVENYKYLLDKLHSLSLCSSQLIVIDW